MNTSRGIIGVVTMAIVTVSILPCTAAQKQQKNEPNIWVEEGPRRPRGPREPGRWPGRFELSDEEIARIMKSLKETNPEEAEELAQLREKEPEKFKAELRKVMRRKRTRRAAPRRTTRRSSIMGMHWRHGELLEWLEKHHPEEAERLRDMRADRPELFERRMGLGLKKYGRILEAARENPELAKALKEDLVLKEKRDKLLRKIRATSDDKRGELVERLEEVISSRFDLIVKRKQIEYEQLRKKLRKLREQVKQSEAEVQKWKDVKDKEIKQRLKELISRTEEFKWD